MEDISGVFNVVIVQWMDRSAKRSLIKRSQHGLFALREQLNDRTASS